MNIRCHINMNFFSQQRRITSKPQSTQVLVRPAEYLLHETLPGCYNDPLGGQPGRSSLRSHGDDPGPPAVALRSLLPGSRASQFWGLCDWLTTWPSARLGFPGLPGMRPPSNNLPFFPVYKSITGSWTLQPALNSWPQGTLWCGRETPACSGHRSFPRRIEVHRSRGRKENLSPVQAKVCWAGEFRCRALW